MAYKPDPIPVDLAELIDLCRAGKLFQVQEWIQSGKRIKPPPGRYSMTPLKAVLRSGFHSMLEVFLRAGLEQEDLDSLLHWSVMHRKPDYVELLQRYGADLNAIPIKAVFDSFDPAIMRTFVAHGIDLEQDRWILYAFRQGNRGFLGIYLDLRDRVPTARLQADMALRYHCQHGSMKWVSLLMWAGANPRTLVPDPEYDFGGVGTALADAIAAGHVDLVKKIGIDPKSDDLAGALAGCCLTESAETVRFLLEAGADLSGEGELSPMNQMIHNLCFRIDPTSPIRGQGDETLRCIRLLADAGVRWRPTRDTASFLRQSISRAGYGAASHLSALMATGAVEDETFSDLMRTPRMREILGYDSPSVEKLREAARWKPVRKKSK